MTERGPVGSGPFGDSCLPSQPQPMAVIWEKEYRVAGFFQYLKGGQK